MQNKTPEFRTNFSRTSDLEFDVPLAIGQSSKIRDNGGSGLNANGTFKL